LGLLPQPYSLPLTAGTEPGAFALAGASVVVVDVVVVDVVVVVDAAADVVVGVEVGSVVVEAATTDVVVPATVELVEDDGSEICASDWVAITAAPSAPATMTRNRPPDGPNEVRPTRLRPDRASPISARF
jgi:hypothetical protein